ncbi:MAG TPA: glycosyltransferase family A protein [Thermoplasmata archaeon]|nr:glycosyltransferase family A protein [Thermoplasmata archaeon]
MRDTGDPNGRPYISVIVTAHDRRQFLQGAVESVLSQTLPASEFEVLVVKFMRDPDLDSWLERQGPRVRAVTDETLPRLGQKLARGIELARGEVVCFLEDDDRYVPEKLETTVDRFRREPGLVYLRNRNRCIDASGRELLGPYARISDHELTISERRPAELALVDFIRHYGAEGNSSIAVRRSIVVPHLRRLSEFSTSTDWVLFVSALSSPGSLVLGTRVLSEYRLHDSLSQSPNQSAGQRLGREIVRTGEILVSMARGTRAERAARFLRGRGAVNWYLMDPGADRPSFEKVRDAAWTAWLRREPTFAIQIAWCGLRLLAPHAVSDAYWEYHRRDSLRQGWRTVESDGRDGPPGRVPGDPPER